MHFSLEADLLSTEEGASTFGPGGFMLQILTHNLCQMFSVKGQLVTIWRFAGYRGLCCNYSALPAKL